jgi:hypothetical protein
MILDKILWIALLGCVLLNLDNMERRIHDLEKRTTRLEADVSEIMSKNKTS